jgi:hypothetical protein
VAIVGQQTLDHLLGRDVVVVVVLDSLQLGDVTNAADGGAADAAHTLGEDVDRRENLFSLIVKEQMVIAKVRAGHVPVEVLGLGVERVRISDDGIYGFNNGLDLLGFKSVGTAN